MLVALIHFSDRRQVSTSLASEFQSRKGNWELSTQIHQANYLGSAFPFLIPQIKDIGQARPVIPE